MDENRPPGVAGPGDHVPQIHRERSIATPEGAAATSPNTGCTRSAQAIKGAFYAKQLAQARKDGRITRVPHEPLLKLDTD